MGWDSLSYGLGVAGFSDDDAGRQLTLDPLEPKKGSVKSAVLHLLQAYPDGLCRRDFANADIFEVSNRIGELEADGWLIVKGRCDRHHHKQRFTLYSI